MMTMMTMMMIRMVMMVMILIKKKVILIQPIYFYTTKEVLAKNVLVSVTCFRKYLNFSLFFHVKLYFPKRGYKSMQFFLE